MIKVIITINDDRSHDRTKTEAVLEKDNPEIHEIMIAAVIMEAVTKSMQPFDKPKDLVQDLFQKVTIK